MNLEQEIVVVTAFIVSTLWLLKSYLKMRQALQWWQGRQVLQLSQEAKNIRDGLLQESFTIRRSLELLPVDNLELLVKKSRDCLEKLDNFHHSLSQLSDRLSPVYIEDSLPLAIQSVVEQWQARYPRLHLHLDLPTHWRHESYNQSMLILQVLEELLHLALSELVGDIAIHISLSPKGKMGELLIHISGDRVLGNLSYSSLKQLKYLRQIFQILTLGKCSYRLHHLAIDWFFIW